ncbi:hypothetical protein GUJ93_ZPchr0006g44534 [Zizania palustris]|uniref:Uncharacterized protein n=1 Tax=Zizania palustris TaxID=103762 RepID=A0A8J5W1R9_ZIZPA|nr:hypothetical protein GUJ93_ZPchr0006g44534 [Zizania palustris]
MNQIPEAQEEDQSNQAAQETKKPHLASVNYLALSLTFQQLWLDHGYVICRPVPHVRAFQLGGSERHEFFGVPLASLCLGLISLAFQDAPREESLVPGAHR